jgi:D-3-phosphoglycerate dehydrogenase
MMKMNIVVIDHIYLNERHLSRLRSLGSLKVFRQPPKTVAELKRRIADADIVMVGWSHLTKEIIDSTKKLVMISIWATSCHYVDLEAAKQKGIVVTHVPAYATEAVAEHTFALMLACARRLVRADRHVRKGRFDWGPFKGVELQSKTLGIIGTGSIGCRVGEIANAFEMKLLGFDKIPNLKKCRELGLKYVDLPTLLGESDFITIHVTLTSETEKLLGQKELESMKKGAIIVNTSQGKVIDEKALRKALKSGRISYAGLDVFDEEPPAKRNKLFSLRNTVLTPHIGFHTVEAVERCSDISIENVQKFLEGQPQNTC